jgi:hypothetical protein
MPIMTACGECLLSSELKAKILRKTLGVALDRLVEHSRAAHAFNDAFT